MTSSIRSTGQIIFVDDETTVLKMMKRLFEDIHEVVGFESPESFLSEINNLNPLVFVLDWTMPKINGLSLCHRIRAIKRFEIVPIIFFSGVEPSEENVVESHAAGAMCFIPKSIGSWYLRSQILAAIAEHEKTLNFLNQHEIILSIVKHDMSNLLTGVISGVEMLKMKQKFSSASNEDETGIILSCSDRLKKIVEDLWFLLIPGNERTGSSDFTEVQVSALVKKAAHFASDFRIEILFDCSAETTVACIPHTVSRAIYYLARLIDLAIGADRQEMTFVSETSSTETKLFLVIPGSWASEINQYIADVSTRKDITKKGILPMVYVEQVLAQHGSKIEIHETEDSTEVGFSLQSGSDCEVSIPMQLHM